MDETIKEDLSILIQLAMEHKREARIALAFLLFPAAIENSGHHGENVCADMAFRMADAFIARAVREYTEPAK